MSSTTGVRPKAARSPAAVAPVARLYVDVPLPHLDRPFDYLVPEELADAVHPGSRVRVRFAGRLVDAYVLERTDASDHDGRLAFVERVVGDEPVLTPQTTALFRAVADRWAGGFVDVVRLGVPSRHAAAERAAWPEAGPAPAAPPDGFDRYRAGAAFLAAVRGGRPARAVWSALPGEDWCARLASAARAASVAGRGVIVVVPDARDLGRLDVAMTHALGDGRHVALSADLGPSERYRRWVAVRRGAARMVIGTRAAAYAPVAELGLVAVWDDGDDLHTEPRAPYPHTRDVLAMRAAQSGAAMLIGGFARTAEAQQLLDSGWAHEVAPTREVLRSVAPAVRPVADDVEIARDPAAAAARLPSIAWRTVRDTLAAGAAVLVQVPRGGYVPTLACARDRTPARCGVCSGPLAAAGSHAVAACRWCGRPAGEWRCPTCGQRRLRAVVVGSARTAEELGRAFPGAVVRTSGGDRVLDVVDGEAAVVVATPGAEPVCTGGYGAVLLLDGWALLTRPELRAAEETLRRWLNAAALARAGAPVIVGADAAVPAVQALVRWDPAGMAARELAERVSLDFPPASRMASLTGPAVAVAEFLAAAVLPDGARTFGPVAAARNESRMLIRVSRERGGGVGAGAARCGGRSFVPSQRRSRPYPARPRRPRLTHRQARSAERARRCRFPAGIVTVRPRF